MGALMRLLCKGNFRLLAKLVFLPCSIIKMQSHSTIVKSSMVEKESRNKTLKIIKLCMVWTDLKLASYKSIRAKSHMVFDI